MVLKIDVETESNKLYTVLKNEDLFIKSSLIERFGQQTMRNLIQFHNLMRKVKIVENNLHDYLNWYQQSIPENPMTEGQFTLEVMTLLCYQGLSTYEYFKRFLLLTLNLNNLNSKVKTRLTDSSTLGSLVDAICKLPNINKQTLNDLFDIDFRNSLAHDSWYLEGSYWMYMKLDGSEISFQFEELAQKIKDIHGLASIIITNYNRDNFPEIVTLYEKLNESFKNGKPPV